MGKDRTMIDTDDNNYYAKIMYDFLLRRGIKAEVYCSENYDKYFVVFSDRKKIYVIEIGLSYCVYQMGLLYQKDNSINAGYFLVADEINDTVYDNYIKEAEWQHDNDKSIGEDIPLNMLVAAIASWAKKIGLHKEIFSLTHGKEMMPSIRRGIKVRATCLNGEVYEGTLYDVCIGIDKEQPTQASIIISEDKSANMKYGQVHIFCSDLKNIENLECNSDS